MQKRDDFAAFERMGERLAAQSQTVETRRRRLMQARTEAVARRDWAEMNEITKRLAKLPVKGE